MRMVGLAVSILCVLAAMGFGCSVTHFLNVPSFLIVCVVGFGSVGIAHGIEGLFLLLKATFSQVPDQAAPEAAETARTAHKGFFGASVLGVIIGTIQVCNGFHDPKLIGPGLAVMLLCALYGLLFCTMLWLPAQRRMETSRS